VCGNKLRLDWPSGSLSLGRNLGRKRKVKSDVFGLKKKKHGAEGEKRGWQGDKVGLRVQRCSFLGNGWDQWFFIWHWQLMESGNSREVIVSCLCKDKCLLHIQRPTYGNLRICSSIVSCHGCWPNALSAAAESAHSCMIA
jgi:hypothetical protein